MHSKMKTSKVSVSNTFSQRISLNLKWTWVITFSKYHKEDRILIDALGVLYGFYSGIFSNWAFGYGWSHFIECHRRSSLFWKYKDTHNASIAQVIEEIKDSGLGDINDLYRLDFLIVWFPMNWLLDFNKKVLFRSILNLLKVFFRSLKKSSLKAKHISQWMLLHVVLSTSNATHNLNRFIHSMENVCDFDQSKSHWVISRVYSRNY